MLNLVLGFVSTTLGLAITLGVLCAATYKLGYDHGFGKGYDHRYWQEQMLEEYERGLHD